MKQRARSALVLALFALAGTVASAQGRVAEPAFEVASVRPLPEEQRFVFRRPSIRSFPGGRFEATWVTVADLIQYAYGRPPFPLQTLEGGAPWVRNERFDVIARAAEDPAAPSSGAPDDVLRMVQHLLAERFQLAIHREQRQTMGYTLVLARSDRRLGPGLQPSTSDCVALREKALREDSPMSSADQLRCAFGAQDGRMRAAGHSMVEFAGWLSAQLQQPVEDRTGLEGPYAIDLTAAPPPGMFTPDVREELAARLNLPPLEVALEEQLALKLEPRPVTYDVIVIDRVERPTEN